MAELPGGRNWRVYIKGLQRNLRKKYAYMYMYIYLYVIHIKYKHIQSDLFQEFSLSHCGN